MPEDKKKSEQMVDIDTSGPAVDVELKEDAPQKEIEVREETTEPVKAEQTKEENKEEKKEVSKPLDSSSEKKEASSEEQETKKDEKKEPTELDEYSEGVKKRIDKLTKKWREAERQREAALSFARGLQEDNVKLKDQFSKLEPSLISEKEAKIIAGLQAAQIKFAAARDKGDITAELEAQKEIAILNYEEQRLLEQKSLQPLTKKIEPPTQTIEEIVAQRTNKIDPKAEAWASKNSWFGQDEAMTYTAFSLHKKLTEVEGYDPQTDEYYAEIDKRIRLDFPHKFANTTTTNTVKPTQTVASATRTSKTGSRKTVRLTPSQVAIAKRLGVPLEEYAKQLTAKEV